MPKSIFSAYPAKSGRAKNFPSENGCNGVLAALIKSSILHLENNKKWIGLRAAYEYIHGYGSGNFYDEAVTDMHTKLAFGFADEALKKGCLDDADNIYRELIKSYPENANSGIRDRAKLGIDDIRSLRSKKND